MLFINLTTVVLVVSTICLLPTNGQTGNLISCVKNIVCDIQPYLTPCCSASFKNETWDKKGMLSCVKSLLFAKAAECMNGPQPGSSGGGEVEGGRYRNRWRTGSSRYWLRPQEGHSAVYGYRTSFPISSKHSMQRSGYGKPIAMQSSDCEFAKNNEPNGTEDCPRWCEATTRCINEFSVIKMFCQSENFMFGGGMGGGMSGMPQPDLFGGMGTHGFGSRGQGSFGGMGNNGFTFGGSFGGMGSGGKGSEGFGNFGGYGAFGGRRKHKGKFPSQHPPTDEREYEEYRK